MIETHIEGHTASIVVNNQMVVIQVQVGKNNIEDVMLDGRTNVNIIINNFITNLGLPKPRPIPYHLRMVGWSMNTPLIIIINLKIHIHGIPYVATFTVLQNNAVDFNYYMLLRRPWSKMQKLHMTRATMSLLFKVMEQSQQYQLTRNWE
jgi:hypothetical protein